MSRPFLPLLARQLEPTGFLAGFAISSYFLGRLFIELPSGSFADKIGRRIPIISGSLCSMIGAVICSLAVSIYSLILGLTIWGLGTALFFTSSMILVIKLSEPHSRGRAIGYFQAVEFVGIFAGSPIGGFVAQYLDYTSVFYISGALICAVFLTVTFFSEDLKQLDSDPVKSLRLHTRFSIKKSIKQLENWPVATLCTASFSRMIITQGIVSTILPIYLNDFLTMTTGLIGIVIGIRTLGLCLGAALCHSIVSKMGQKPTVVGAMLTSSLFVCLYSLAHSFESSLALAFAEGFGAGIVSVILVLLIPQHVTQESTGSAIGLYRTFMDLGGFVGPILMMTMYATFNIQTGFLLGAIFLASSAVTLSILKIQHCTLLPKNNLQGH